MQITKFQHACFVIEANNHAVVVDPGELTMDFVVPETPISCIVVTHVHGDHLDQEKLRAIQTKHTNAAIYAHQEVIDKLNVDITNSHVVNAGDSLTVGDFNLEFTGGEHALIHPSVPMCSNLGVWINDIIYYPGDSFNLPKKPVKILALPISAPWMNTAEGMDYLTIVKPEIAIAMHDEVLSDAGKKFTDYWMQIAAEKSGVDYKRLDSTPFVIE